MHSGIWNLCIDLSDLELYALDQYEFPYTNKCNSYLAGNSMNFQNEYSRRGDYQTTNRSTMSKMVIIGV